MESPIMFSTKMTPAAAAEQSRIATAQGMRDVAAALAAAQYEPILESDGSCDDSSSDSSRKRKRRRRRTTPSRSIHEDESAAHYVRLELMNAKVDNDDLRTEISKLKDSLDPYNVINNELAYIKSSIERSNKDTEQLTLIQLEKRRFLFKEEYKEHIALCSAACSKLTLAEVKSSFLRIIAVEKKRALNAENSLEWSIKIRRTTRTVSKITALSVVVALFGMFIYWYFASS